MEDINIIKNFTRKKIVKGFTTNPTLIRKAGAKNYTEYCKRILKVTKKPISFEVFADENEKIIKQAKKIKNWGRQIYVKVPVVNSKGHFLGKAIKELNKDKIKLNSNFFVFTGSTVGVVPLKNKGDYIANIDKIGTVKSAIR